MQQAVGQAYHPVRETEAIYDRIALRIMPFLVLLFVVAWLDRINVGFARLQMVKDLGFSDAAFGFGAGIFYLGYLIFEIPSNLLLERIGARKTFARITILWGVTSMATMLVKSAAWFYVLRFSLGAFEAGLVPGTVLYLTYWFPARRRAGMMGLFMAAIPIAGAIGGPLSGLIMASTRGRLGLANWQWLFLLEGIPSVVLGLLTFAIFADKPSTAGWLTENEKRLVSADLEIDNSHAGPRQHGLVQALTSPQVWLLTLIQFCLTSAQSDVRHLGTDHHRGPRRERQFHDRPALRGAIHRRCGGFDSDQPALGSNIGTAVSRGDPVPGVRRGSGLDRRVCEPSGDRIRRADRRHARGRGRRRPVLAVPADAARGQCGRWRYCAHQLGRQLLGFVCSIYCRLAQGRDWPDSARAVRGRRTGGHRRDPDLVLFARPGSATTCGASVGVWGTSVGGRALTAH